MNVNEDQEMVVEDFFTMCENEGGVYQIDTPDGWININLLLTKSNKECVLLRLDDGFEINCASSHLVKTEHGWKEAINLDVLEDRVLTCNGYKKIITIEGIVDGSSFDPQTTFDFNIDSDSSAYYANGVVSHNSGKSLAAKASASFFQIPLLRLDFGALFGQYMGESEKQARLAISVAEKVAPCVTGDATIVFDGLHVPIKNVFNIYTEQPLDTEEKVDDPKEISEGCYLEIRKENALGVCMFRSDVDLGHEDTLLFKEKHYVAGCDDHGNPIDVEIFGIIRRSMNKNKLLKITLEDGKTLTLTDNHKLLVKTATGTVWKCASQLTTEDDIVSF